MIVQVTKENIQQGRRRSPCSCPIALAIKGAMAGVRPSVGVTQVDLKFGGGIKAVAHTGRKGAKFITNFDNFGRKAVRPIKLNLKFIVQ